MYLCKRPVYDFHLLEFCREFFYRKRTDKKGLVEPDLSEMFTSRYSTIRKVQLHLALKGKNYFTPGGQFHDIQWVISNYGMVPEEVYSGKKSGVLNHNHSLLDTLLKEFVNRLLKEGKEKLSPTDMIYLERLLDENLGKVPGQFSYKWKTYTPKTYASEWLHVDPSDYIEITSYTHHPFYRPFVLEDKYNWTGDNYFNVPLQDFVSITKSALQNGYTVCWDGDVTESTFDYSNGIAWLPGQIDDLTGQRQETYENGTSALDHMMHIVGMSMDKDGHSWFRVKNSWGDYSNALMGFLYMREDYFSVKTMAIVVNKKAIPVEIRKKMTGER